MQFFGEGHGSPQRRALLAYLALTEQRQNWVRRLVLLTGSEAAAPFALAVLTAGGAVLWTGADEASLRESSLAGLIDFQVTTLSEALRILKNEIRKGLPVSVGVLDADGAVWTEAVARGVQPEALMAGARDIAAAEILMARGAWRLEVPGAAELREHRAATWRERRAGDAMLLAGIERSGGAEREVAERWLRSAARLFPRDTARCYAAAWVASKDSR